MNQKLLMLQFDIAAVWPHVTSQGGTESQEGYLLLWRYSRPAWTRSCAACCRWPCFGRGVGPDGPQRSLPTPNILGDSMRDQKRESCLGFGTAHWQVALTASFENE